MARLVSIWVYTNRYRGLAVGPRRLCIRNWSVRFRVDPWPMFCKLPARVTGHIALAQRLENSGIRRYHNRISAGFEYGGWTQLEYAGYM